MKLNLKRAPRFRPRRPRHATSITTALLMPDDREIVIIVRNMSGGGFMAMAGEELAAGTWLGIDLPGRGIRRAQVRWFADGMFGARFEAPLSPEEVELELE